MLLQVNLVEKIVQFFKLSLRGVSYFFPMKFKTKSELIKVLKGAFIFLLQVLFTLKFVIFLLILPLKLICNLLKNWRSLMRWQRLSLCLLRKLLCFGDLLETSDSILILGDYFFGLAGHGLVAGVFLGDRSALALRMLKLIWIKRKVLLNYSKIVHFLNFWIIYFISSCLPILAWLILWFNILICLI